MGEWSFCSKDIPKSEIVFSQIIAIYFVIGFSIYNITVGNQNTNLRITLLSSCLGYLLPSPVIKRMLFTKLQAVGIAKSQNNQRSLLWIHDEINVLKKFTILWLKENIWTYTLLPETLLENAYNMRPWYCCNPPIYEDLSLPNRKWIAFLHRKSKSEMLWNRKHFCLSRTIGFAPCKARS